MDPTGLHVKLSGPLLGKILHEQHKHSGSCGGMLYGEVVSETKSEITDSQHLTKTSAYVCIRDYFPVSNKAFFNIQASKHKAWEEDSYSPLSSCVGFFRIRNTSNKMLLLEKSIHKRLRKNLESRRGNNTADFIVTLLINFGSNTDITCLDWAISAFVFHNSEFKRIKIEVSNLQGSVSGLYISNPSPVSNAKSANSSAILEAFQASSTNKNGGIHIVEATRKATQDLISEMDRAFEKLQVNEQLLETAHVEKARLLSEWNALLVKKKAKEISFGNSRHGASNACPMEKLRTVEEDRGFISYQDMQTEDEYQAVKRRSLEDIRRRSPIVVLEKLDAENVASNILELSPEISDDINDPFAGLVSSVKSELSRDEAEYDMCTGYDRTTKHDHI